MRSTGAPANSFFDVLLVRIDTKMKGKVKPDSPKMLEKLLAASWFLREGPKIKHYEAG